MVLQQIMVANPAENLDTMFEFCRDFGINVNVEIIALIQSLIIAWQPTLAIELVEGVESENFREIMCFVSLVICLSCRNYDYEGQAF